MNLQTLLEKLANTTRYPAPEWMDELSAAATALLSETAAQGTAKERHFSICKDHVAADWNQPVLEDDNCILCRLFYLEAQEGLLEEWQQRAKRAEDAIAEVKRPLDEQMARLNATVVRLNEENERKDEKLAECRRQHAEALEWLEDARRALRSNGGSGALIAGPDEIVMTIDTYHEFLSYEAECKLRKKEADATEESLALARAATSPDGKEENERLTIALRAWHQVFGTTQLTHARARLEAAEAKAANGGSAKAPEGYVAVERNLFTAVLNYPDLRVYIGSDLYDALAAAPSNGKEEKR